MVVSRTAACLLVLLVGASAQGADRDQPGALKVAIANATTTLEDLYTPTPVGKILSHCVHEVPSGAHVKELDDGRMHVTAPGGVVTLLPKCDTDGGKWPIRQAREEGLEVTADLYPYEYWQSTMTVLFPDRSFTREAATFALQELAPPEGMLIDRYEPNRSYEGQTLAEISDLRKSDPVTTYLDLIAESQAAEEAGSGGGESIIGTSMATQDIATLLKWPYTNVASDGSSTSRHPRGYGSFAKIFRMYVRERGDLSLEEAVHKMTGLASETLGLQARGTLEVGSVADMVLFDPEKITDNATRQAPHAQSSGVIGVWVAGSRVYDNGLFTGVYPGQWIEE